MGELATPSAPATPKPSYTAAPATPALSPLATPAGTAHGAPYTAAEIAAELRDVPPDFPAALRSSTITREISDAAARTIWSYDGRPYRDLRFQGSCDEGGVQRCEVTATGVPLFVGSGDNADTYNWQITNAGITTLGEPQLKGYPAELDPELDAMARSLDRDGRLTGLSLLGVEWKLAPPQDAYVLRYGTGNEEGDRALLVTLDRAGRQILAIRVGP
jgi:hypothetical protein